MVSWGNWTRRWNRSRLDAVDSAVMRWIRIQLVTRHGDLGVEAAHVIAGALRRRAAARLEER
jgi:hypothetical protein